MTEFIELTGQKLSNTEERVAGCGYTTRTALHVHLENLTLNLSNYIEI
jgi:hypothetical protein